MPTTTITTEVSPETALWLEQEARLHGLDSAWIAAVVLDDAAKAGVSPIKGASHLSSEERLRRFRAAMDKVPARPGPPVDTNRESIYD